MSTIPGLLLAILIAIFGGYASETLGLSIFGTARSPLSPVIVAILAGLLIRNLVGVHTILESGIKLSLKFVLQLGIVLLGLKLGLSELGEFGVQALPIVIVCLSTALVLVILLGKMFRVPDRLATLIAVGTAICGATAIVATSPVIGAKQNETSYAVACIAVFGLSAMLVYPMLSQWLFGGDAIAAGIFLGTSVHDTAQVIGAGMAYDQMYGSPATLEAATVTKMLRNLSMLLVIPLMSIRYHRGNTHGGQSRALLTMVPLFIVGFAIMSLLRTLGDMGERPFGLLTTSAWNEFLDSASFVCAFCLTVAMAAVGLSTNLKDILHIGLKPMLMGLIAALLVGIASTLMVYVLII